MFSSYRSSGAQEQHHHQQTEMSTSRFKIRKRGFKFCRRDRFGIRPYPGGREMIKPSPLGGELILRTEMRIIEAKYYSNEGIREWDVYREHLPSITENLAAIDAALERYKARRLERGLYYLVPMVNSISFWIHSPLNDPPGSRRREDALRKRRILRKKRKAVAAAGLLVHHPEATTSEITSSPLIYCSMWYVAYLVSVVVLSYVIIFT